jgi:hypothetical protein
MAEKKTWFITSLNIPMTESEFLQRFDEIARRDGKSRSQLILISMKEYMERHTPPNPQATLERTMAVNMPVKSNNCCCVPDCRGKAKYRLNLKDFNGKTEVFNTCLRHKNWRHEKFKFLVGVKEL